MPKLIFIFMFSINYLIAQSNIQHVVYFETDKYIVPETEKNRLLLFTQNLDIKPEDEETIESSGIDIVEDPEQS